MDRSVYELNRPIYTGLKHAQLKLASYTGRKEGEKVAWYQLHVHASTFP